MFNFIGKFLPVKIFGRFANQPVDVVFDEVTNQYRLAVDQVVKVESLRGFSDIPDNWFFINAVGNTGDSFTLDINASDGAFAYNYTTNVLAAEDRQAFTDRVLSELNADILFSPSYRAVRVKDTPIIIIKSKFFGEWGEIRDFAGGPVTPNTFRTTVTGGMNIPVAFGDFQRRNKLNSLATDPRDERFGQFGISGNVTIGGAIQNFYDEFFVNNGSNEMAINAQNVDQTFSVPITADRDLEINEIRLWIVGNGVSLGDSFGTGQALGDGVVLRWKSDNVVKEIGPIFSNSDLKNLWSVGSPTNFRLDKPSGKDELLASFRVGSPIVLRKIGTFGPGNDDYLEIVIRDRIDNKADTMKALAVGFKSEF